MAVTWTREQQMVIDTCDRDILVSAAAGSGKTAVLVARILKKITDEQKPVDIDRLLVVTFTNAAASEMRERIRDALEAQAMQDPENAHLQRQLVLVHNAKITTIHSFCLHVLRNHFQTIGIDPAFRVADEGEVLLLEQEAVQEIVNEAYANSDELFAAEFTEFLEQMATGKRDDEIAEMILQLYHFALGQPFPEEWLQTCRTMYDDAGKENSRAAWFSFIESDTALRLRDIRDSLEAALLLTREPDGPWPYESAILSDLELVDSLISAKTWPEYLAAFRSMAAFARLGTKKDGKISDEKKQQVQAMRADCKDQIIALRDQYYYDEEDALRENFYKSGVTVRVLTRLTELFMKRLSEKKADKNILDFGDMEHLALNALVVKKEDELAPTAVAQEYAETFEEVMIDEYQDSNLVQELILSSVSGKGCGLHNRFMVGDVKQSIYRFRLARPELFMEKYHRYPMLNPAEENAAKAEAEITKAAETEAENEKPVRTEAADTKDNKNNTNECRIDLHRNFRSRHQVLDLVNSIFRQIMTEPLGGVVYDTDAALYPGAIFPEAEWKDTKQADAGCGNEENHELYNENGAGWYTSELLLLDGSAGGTSQNQAYEATTGTSEERESEASTAAGSSAGLREEEARMVGRRILELAGTMPVLDKESGTFRPARYGDMVILLRSVSGWAEIFGEVLGNMGIPCFTGSQKGYFSTAEIRIVLSYLKILDNPMQDIPLAAVLRSAIGRFTDEELAGIRLAGIKEPGLSFYDCCLRYLEQSPDTQISKKLKDFFSVYEQLREKCSHTPVHLLLWELLDVTGYGEYAAALPAGWQRKANLDMLVEKAIAYEATSYRGLFHFVRYIENLQKYEVDYGEANLGSEADDTVRIMSIHKSKGLEFPIVFVSGLGKQFNESDVRSRVVMHPEWGIACDYISNTADTLPRMRQPTLLKKMIQRQLASENLGEELRVLYVAMTRAKEKLILTGSVKDLEKRKIAWKAASSRKEGTLSYSWLSGASTYLDWIVPSLTGNRDVDFPAGGGANTEDERQFEIREVHSMENAAEEAQGRTEDLLTLQELLHMDPSVCHDKEAKEYLEQVFSSAYPYEANRKIPGKITVSELKKMSQRMEEKDAQELYAPEPVIPLFPEFERLSDSFINGAARGTAYHTFMENLDFSKKEHLRFQLEELIRCGKMSEEEAATICLDEIAAFLHSEIGIRMELAAREGRLFREQPFVLGISSDEVYGNQGSSRIDERQQAEPHQSIMEPETILVQGIIDAYFFDEDRITLVDYKTDRVSSGNILVKRYRTQMDYYAKALERLTGKRLRDRIIYSFCLKKEIHL